MSTQEKRSTAYNRTTMQGGQTSFGVACIVALLLECASEGKSEDYLSKRRQTAMHIHGSMEETGVYTANHNQPRVVVCSSFVPTFQHSHSCILPPQDSKSVSKYSLRSPERIVRAKVLPSGYQSTLHRRTATTKLQTKLGGFFRWPSGSYQLGQEVMPTFTTFKSPLLTFGLQP